MGCQFGAFLVGTDASKKARMILAFLLFTCCLLDIYGMSGSALGFEPLHWWHDGLL